MSAVRLNQVKLVFASSVAAAASVAASSHSSYGYMKVRVRRAMISRGVWPCVLVCLCLVCM